MDRWLRTHFRILLMCMIAAAAYFQAVGLNWLLVSELRVPAPRPSLARSIPAAPGDVLHDTSAAAILARNPFDSATGPLDVQPIRPRASPRRDDDPYSDATCNATRVTLIVASDVDNSSFAAIAVGRGPARLYRPGDVVSGRTVLDVAWDRVWLAGEDGRCQLELHGEREAPAPALAPVPRRRRAASLPPRIASKIHRISETQFDVERTAVDLVLERPAELLKRTRVAPWKRGGRVVGVRMERIASGGLLHTLGLRRGDVIRSVNGRSIADPEQALEAYARLRTTERLEVAIERDGEPTTLELRIR